MATGNQCIQRIVLGRSRFVLHGDNKRCLSTLNNDRVYTKLPCTRIRRILKTEIFLSVLKKKKKDTGPKPSTGCTVFETFLTLKRWKNDNVLYRAMLVIYDLARNNWRHFYIGLNLSHRRIRKRWFSSVHRPPAFFFFFNCFRKSPFLMLDRKRRLRVDGSLQRRIDWDKLEHKKNEWYDNSSV